MTIFAVSCLAGIVVVGVVNVVKLRRIRRSDDLRFRKFLDGPSK